MLLKIQHFKARFDIACSVESKVKARGEIMVSFDFANTGKTFAIVNMVLKDIVHNSRIIGKDYIAFRQYIKILRINIISEQISYNYYLK